MSRLNEIKEVLPPNLYEKIRFFKSDYNFELLQEIRLRINQPVIVLYNNREFIFNEVIATKEVINQCVEFISDYSLYAYQEDLKSGFITVKGGHRVGLTGKVLIENGKIKGQQYISFINIRIAHEMIGCADKVMKFVCKNRTLEHTLIVSPPGCGKTTLLRDVIRQLSMGNIMQGKKVGVVDERSEIAACFNGIPQNDLGPRTDVVDCCPKAEGMLMLIRSMSPEIVAVDELGGKDDVDAVEYLINSGCIILGTVHGSSVNDLKAKPGMDRLMDMNLFKRIIILSRVNGVGTVKDMISMERSSK